MAKKSKEYHIDSFEKLINVMNDENIQNICIDFCKWMMYVNRIISEYRKNNPEEEKGKLNWEIVKCAFIWIDDKKNDFKGFKINDNRTGEVVRKDI